MLANLLQCMYSIVDMAVVGHYVGSVGLSAVSVGGQVTYFYTAFAMGLSNGSQVLVSQLVGADDSDGLRRAIGTSFTAMLVISLPITIGGAVLTHTMVNIMNTPEASVAQAVDYLLICSVGMVFTYGYNAVCSILRGLGDSTRPLVFIAIAAAVNLILDLVFVAWLDMGVAGAALATVIGQASSFIFAIVYLYRHKESFGFDFRPASFIPDMHKLKILLRIGLPATLQMCSISLSMMFINAYVNTYGVVASAVSGIGNKLFNFANIITVSIRNAGTGMVGQNIAADRTDRVKRIVYDCFAICIVFGAFLTALCLIFPRQLFTIFNKEPEVLAIAPEYLRIYCHAYLAACLMAPSLALIYGVGAASFNFCVAILDGVIARIGLSLLLGITLGLGLHGFWWGSAAAGYVTVLIGLIYFLSGKWKNKRLLVTNTDITRKEPT